MPRKTILDKEIESLNDDEIESLNYCLEYFSVENFHATGPNDHRFDQNFKALIYDQYKDLIPSNDLKESLLTEITTTIEKNKKYITDQTKLVCFPGQLTASFNLHHMYIRKTYKEKTNSEFLYDRIITLKLLKKYKRIFKIGSGPGSYVLINRNLFKRYDEIVIEEIKNIDSIEEQNKLLINKVIELNEVVNKQKNKEKELQENLNKATEEQQVLHNLTWH